MLRKLTLVCYFIILSLLIVGCQPQVKELAEEITSESTEIEIERETFDDDYRPNWWENIENTDYLHSYAFIDGSDQEKIKVDAINSAQKRFLHYKKSYVVSLTDLIIEEINAKDKFKSKSLSLKNGTIYDKDYSRFLKRIETDFIPKDESNYRCFVAIALPLDAIQKEYVTQFQKNKSIARAFAKSETYRFLLRNAGLEVIPEEKIIEKKIVEEEKTKPTVPTVKYDADVVPAWFKISYNNKKVMVNQTAIASTADKAEQEATNKCKKNKIKSADNYARAEAEKYRGISEYDEVKFAKFKNQISNAIMKSDYPLTKEFIKTIQIGEKQYKTYAQYSINKLTIQSILMNVLQADDVLYSRLRASMAEDELDNEDF